MLAPGIAGERFIGAGPFAWMADIAAVLKDKLGPKARKVPTRKLPNALIKVLSAFDPIVRDRLFELDKYRPASDEKARRVLGWMPRSNETMIVDTANSLLAEGIVTVA